MASNRMLALLGLLAVAGYQNRDRLAEMLGGITGQGGGDRRSGSQQPNSAGAANAGGLGGLLGGLFGGAEGGQGLKGGLSDLIQSMSGGGQAEVADSWVQTGPNRKIEPDQLRQALGEDTLEALSRQTGLGRDELLSRLK